MRNRCLVVSREVLVSKSTQAGDQNLYCPVKERTKAVSPPPKVTTTTRASRPAEISGVNE
jgi:hypothetical protein